MRVFKCSKIDPDSNRMNDVMRDVKRTVVEFCDDSEVKPEFVTAWETPLGLHWRFITYQNERATGSITSGFYDVIENLKAGILEFDADECEDIKDIGWLGDGSD